MVVTAGLPVTLKSEPKWGIFYAFALCRVWRDRWAVDGSDYHTHGTTLHRDMALTYTDVLVEVFTDHSKVG